MSTAGTVLEISGTSLKIERTLKGKAEIMEFILEKPFPNIAAGDPVKVSYLEKDGRNVLIRVAPAKKTAVKKAVKKELPKRDETGRPFRGSGNKVVFNLHAPLMKANVGRFPRSSVVGGSEGD